MNNGFDLDKLSYEERNNILFNADILNEESDEEFVLILYL